uniref:Nucleotide-sugar transporter n=1 Tax=Acrobeloides nanus TaxID=290746 RepID=A0A914C6B0_9BILA
MLCLEFDLFHFDAEKIDQYIGIGLVLAMCLISAFASIYLEKMFKNSPDDLWLQNIRLSIIMLLISVGYIIFNYIYYYSYDFLQGWSFWNWIISLTNAISGLIIASVIKYADNIRKSFFQSLAVCGTAFLSIVLGDSSLTIELSLKTILVIVSIVIYTLGGAKPPLENDKGSKDIENNKTLGRTETCETFMTIEMPKEIEKELKS